MRNSKNLGRLAGLTGTAIAGVIFFLIIMGVFGLRFAFAGLVVFVLAAVVICRAFPADGAAL
jgi:hypothetical protein